MPQPTIKLYQFPISHYCEKVRWALEYKSIVYEQINLVPGLHSFVVKKMAIDSSVPVLRNGDRAIQGSSQIIDYLDDVVPKPTLGFQQSDDRKKVLELESFLDNEVAVLLRSIAYNVLLKHREALIALWSQQGPCYSRIWLRLSFPIIIRVVGESYQTGDEFTQKHRNQFERALDKLDTLYQFNPYLVGNRFSRVDLTAAALLSPLVLPKEFPIPPPVAFPTEYEEYRLKQKDRPVFKRVEDLYEQYRHTQPDNTPMEMPTAQK